MANNVPPQNLNKSNTLDAYPALGLTLFVAGQYLRRHVQHHFLVLWACLAITDIRTGQYVPGEGEIWADGFDVWEAEFRR